MWICEFCKFIGEDDMDYICKNSNLDMDSAYLTHDKCNFFINRNKNKVVVKLNRVHFRKIFIVK